MLPSGEKFPRRISEMNSLGISKKKSPSKTPGPVGGFSSFTNNNNKTKPHHLMLEYLRLLGYSDVFFGNNGAFGNVYPSSLALIGTMIWRFSFCFFRFLAYRWILFGVVATVCGSFSFVTTAWAAGQVLVVLVV